jgi:NitT/TauT family transport system substrate-binding protein
MNFRLFRTIAMLLTVGLFLGLGSSPAPSQTAGPAAAPEKPHLKVGLIPISNLVPLHVAQKLGYLKEGGLTIETTTASGGPALTSGVIGGSLDLTYTNYVSISQAVAEGFELMVVAHQNNAQEAPPDAAAIVVRADSPITKAADLTGKRIALNALTNINRIAAQYYLEKHGVAADKVKFIEVPFPNMGDLLAQGQADAAFLVEPFKTILTKAGKIKPIAYPFIDVTPSMPIACFVASKKFVRDHPVTVERFVAALARANDYLNANREELVKYTAEYTKSSPDLIREVVLDRWTHIANEKNIQLLADLSHKYGFQKRPIKVSEIIYKTARK